MRRERRARVVGCSLDLSPISLGQGMIDQKDVADPMRSRRIHDVFFGREQMASVIDPDEPGVRSVGDILDQAKGQADQRDVLVDGPVERATALQVEAGEHKVAQAAVGEVERVAAPAQETCKAVERSGDAGPWFRLDAIGQGADFRRGSVRLTMDRRKRASGILFDRLPRATASPAVQSVPARTSEVRRQASMRSCGNRKVPGCRRENRRTSPVDAPSS